MKCIEVSTGKSSAGYGMSAINIGGREYHVLAHRLMFEQAWGIKLKPGQLVRHTCDNRTCINPMHLQLGSHSDNLKDAYDRGRVAWNKGLKRTHCSMGHEFNEANTRINKHGTQECRACGREHQRQLRAR